MQVACLTVLVGTGTQMRPEDLVGVAGFAWLGAVAATALGLAASATAKNIDQAMSVVVVVLVQQLLFAGLLVPLDHMQSVQALLADLSLSRWTLGGLCAAADVQGLLTDLKRPVTEVAKTDAGQAVTALVLLLGVCLVAAWICGARATAKADRD
jgi:hypothetical protein